MTPLSLFFCGHERRCGVELQSLLSLSLTFLASSLLSSFLSSRSRSSHSDVPLHASSSAWPGTRLLTSVVERKSRAAWLHPSPARGSGFSDLEGILGPPGAPSHLHPQDFLLVLSLRAVPGKILRVCFLYRHHQRLAVGWLFVHSRY